MLGEGFQSRGIDFGRTFGGKEGAVDEKIGVAANGGGEVGVVGFGQAEVAEAFWGVDGAFERAKEADLEGVAVGSAGKNFENLLNLASLGEVACFDAVGDEELSIFLEARFLGSFMDTVDGGTVFLVEVTGD